MLLDFPVYEEMILTILPGEGNSGPAKVVIKVEDDKTALVVCAA